MNAKELQAKLREIRRLIDRQRELIDIQDTDVRGLRGQVRQRQTQQELEAEHQRLSSHLNSLNNKPGSK